MGCEGTRPRGQEHRMKSEIHWPSVVQLGLSLVGVLFLWGLFLSLVVVGVTQLANRSLPLSSSMSALLLAAGAALCGALLLPSAGYALARLLGRPVVSTPDIAHRMRPSLWILALPLVLLLGYLVAGDKRLAWFALPPLHILAIGLPVLWLVTQGQRGLPAGSPQRAWGVFAGGLLLGPSLILAAETAALLVFVLLAAIWLARDPALLSQMATLAQQLSEGRATPDALFRLLSPYLTQPLVIYSAFAFTSGVVPLIEEALKPAGVWLLAGRELTPAQGFAAGILSGAGYALFESLALASSSQEWTVLVFARIGTAIIHILTTGLSGWALALAWKEGRYLRLGLTYLGVALIHGLWNSLTLTVSFHSIYESLGKASQFPLLNQISTIAPYGLAVMSVGGLGALLLVNRRLHRSQQKGKETVLQSTVV